LKHKIKAISNDASLNLLNENALKEAFKVDILVHQKFIKTKDVNPINSQPKKRFIILFVETKKIILQTKKLKYIINLSTNGSYLKYEKEKQMTPVAILKVKNKKLNEILSKKKSNLILTLLDKLIHLPKFI